MIVLALVVVGGIGILAWRRGAPGPVGPITVQVAVPSDSSSMSGASIGAGAPAHASAASGQAAS